jgi:riboflavin biosynthesis pyrimidine reductase
VNISSPATLVLAHQLRAAHDCILIGAGTAKADNPRLTVRYSYFRLAWPWLEGRTADRGHYLMRQSDPTLLRMRSGQFS